MKTIEASEDSFGRANNFYILMWVVTSLVVVTAFVDFRSYHREVDSNTQLINFYSEFERDAGDVARHIRSAVYLMPGYKNEKDGIETIRKLRSASLAHHKWLNSNLLKRTPNLTIEQRIEINTAFNYMHQMVLLNDAIDPVAGKIDSEGSLLLAEHEAGSYLVSESVENLRIEDAARYLWLSTLSLPQWFEVLNKHVTALKAGTVLSDFGSDLTRVANDVRADGQKAKRKIASDIWIKWIKSASDDGSTTAGGKQEVRRRLSLTLAQTSVFLKEAYQKQAQLNLRAGGQASTVKIPVISIPLQLRDAALVTPWVLVFCALAISIYTRRAIRYAPKKASAGIVVGNVPSFYAFYGFNKPIGIAVAIILLLIPPLLLAFVLPVLIPVIIDGWYGQAVFYFTGVVIAILFLILTLSQIPNVLRLIDEGIAIRAAPQPPFPHVGWKAGNLSARQGSRSPAPVNTNVVPTQFQACWKYVTAAGRTHYLQLMADGRYFLSSGKQAFAIQNNGNEFNWDGDIWNRNSGTGQDIVGGWVLGADEFIVRSDGTSTYHITHYDIPGLIETFGDTSSGDVIYWEQRAIIDSAINDGNGNFQVTSHSMFGGTHHFTLRLRNDQMMLTNNEGDVFMYDRVNCQTL